MHCLDRTSYQTCTLAPVKELVTLVLLVDSTTKHGEELVRAYGKVLTKHRYRNLRVYFACYCKHRNWYGDLLSQCPCLPRDEVVMRVSGCVCGDVATAMLLFGAKKQLLLFPEKFEVVCELYRGLKREGQEGEGAGQEERGRRCQKRGVARDKAAKRNHEVGKVLGNTFGYESSSSESDDCSHGSDDSSHMPHPLDGSGDSSHMPCPLHAGSDCSHESGDKGSDGDHLADMPHPLSASPAHRPHPLDPSGRGTPSLVEQVHTHFGNWCERLADGTLKRYGVEAWPEWPRP